MLRRFYARINRTRPWYRLPFLLGLFNLIALREQLREDNLVDTRTPGGASRTPGVTPATAGDERRRFRTADGSYNDLGDPDMGRAGTRFARNVPLAHAWPAEGDELMTPNPREISRTLMRRETFTPATSINLLAAAWIQFQTHDWFAHGREPVDVLEIDIEDGDDWFEKPMRIPRTKVDNTRTDADRDLPPTFLNSNSHWWDASSIYGSTPERREQVRSHVDGKLVLKDGNLPLDPATGVALTGFSENWWVGLGLLHTLFTLEHNAICDRLKKDYPGMTEDELFGTAQLVVSALLAKIHTVEWTPAIIAHPVLKVAMRANWWGLAEEKLHRMFGRLSRSEVISGIPGSAFDHHGSPYQLTEEFAAVYRLHPLLPDTLEVHSLDDGTLVDSMDFPEIILLNAHRVLTSGAKVQDLWYSFGVQHPGAVQLHNFPRWMQDITLPDGLRLDLAALDVMRDRERGVPRYNEFRRQLHLKPAATFDELTDNPTWARELEAMYGDVEKVDLQVGMHAETPPPGFGFSDTAFRVFILMASRRLKSDRFITDCYTEEYYTKTGMQWIADNTMASVLLRHYPQLAPSLDGVKNAFAPWNVVGPDAARSTTTASAAASAAGQGGAS
ncbi:peroxidase family protein [Microbacterium trichothecenolyticum]|uniref:peroxidase family protein n=1 Tax=Microbacterium trichothecenolyticum TaxID=69370 RepID=UPI0035BE217E